MSAPRRPIIAANWKMHTTPSRAPELARETLTALTLIGIDLTKIDLVLCPPAISLFGVHTAVAHSLLLGAQNLHTEQQGAYTGEISGAMLTELCTYVLIGHSERRQYFGETDEIVHRKVRAALSSALYPIICVGETLALRAAGQTHDWISLQVRGALYGLSFEELSRVVVAYEPVWAIGTGVAASGDDAQAVALTIRRVLTELGGEALAQTIRIQYGGSVNAANAQEFLHLPDIDGALVGGASLKPQEFASIVHAVDISAADTGFH